MLSEKVLPEVAPVLAPEPFAYKPESLVQILVVQESESEDKEPVDVADEVAL